MSPIPQEIDSSAADWAARLDRAPPLSAEEQRALDHWLEADARHRGAFMRMRAIAFHTERARALGPEFDPEQFTGADQARPTRQRDTAADQARQQRERGAHIEGRALRSSPVRSLRRTGLVAASAIAAAVLIAIVLPLFIGRGQTYDTRRGEIRVVSLDDGSVMTLNTASRARVSFDASAREIRLTAGEALFEVAADADRPFVVRAADQRIVALATKFSVRHDAGTLQVMVTEGKVRVEGASAHARDPAGSSNEPSSHQSTRSAREAPVILTAGAVAQATGNNLTIRHKAPAELVNHDLAWRDGRIAFESETLAAAATAFARYSPIRIVIDDPAVANMEITGLFTANDPVSFARAAAASLGLEAQVRAEEVRLSR
jgi:transmembrane sensor